jgi:hypothetical protein
VQWRPHGSGPTGAEGPGRSAGDRALVRRFLAGRLQGDRVNAFVVAAYAHCSADELLTLVNQHLQPRGLSAGFGGRIALSDGLIHHQDIRRALGIPRELPTDRLQCALQFAPQAPRSGQPNASAD